MRAPPRPQHTHTHLYTVIPTNNIHTTPHHTLDIMKEKAIRGGDKDTEKSKEQGRKTDRHEYSKKEGRQQRE